MDLSDEEEIEKYDVHIKKYFWKTTLGQDRWIENVSLHEALKIQKETFRAQKQPTMAIYIYDKNKKVVASQIGTHFKHHGGE